MKKVGEKNHTSKLTRSKTFTARVAIGIGLSPVKCSGVWTGSQTLLGS